MTVSSSNTSVVAVKNALDAVYENKQSNKKNDISGDFSSDNVSYPTAKAVKTELSGKVDKAQGSGNANKYLATDSSGNVTLIDSVSVDVSSKEDKSNKVKSTDGWTGTPTDDHYPSEKLVKDSLDAKISTSNTIGLIKNDGTVDTNTYSQSGHTHGAGDVTDSGANDYTNLGSLSSGASQATINAAIDSKIGDFLNIDFVVVTDDKGTASSSTLNKLYIEVGNSSTDVYYTKATTSNGTTTYAWASLDTDILDNLVIPSDVSDLTDNSNTAFTPKSHSHGNITNSGAIGSTANLPLITTTGGAVTTGSFGNSANTFAEGNHTHSGYVGSSDVNTAIEDYLAALAGAINPSS